MILPKGHHLTYCTNIHRGETWVETMAALSTHTLAVRDRIGAAGMFGIGLWLSDRASRELASEPGAIDRFREWLDRNKCYVFTLNGFPYGAFHGGPVKDRVYLPDWTTEERVAYTNRLFDILAALLPPGIEGSISTLPGGFKEFVREPAQARAIRQNLFRTLQHASRVTEQTGRQLHLALEPEPLCLLETIDETIQFFQEFRDEHRDAPSTNALLGVNYDTCHLAVEFEDPSLALRRLREHDIAIKKLHLSSALKTLPTAEARRGLRAFAEGVWLHQVVARMPSGSLARFKDLDLALAAPDAAQAESWRVHFHIPLHCPDGDWFKPTTDHLLTVLDELAANPALCPHLEMETYTWEALPPNLKSGQVSDQLAAEYEWTLTQLKTRGLA